MSAIAFDLVRWSLPSHLFTSYIYYSYGQRSGPEGHPSLNARPQCDRSRGLIISHCSCIFSCRRQKAVSAYILVLFAYRFTRSFWWGQNKACKPIFVPAVLFFYMPRKQHFSSTFLGLFFADLASKKGCALRSIPLTICIFDII